MLKVFRVVRLTTVVWVVGALKVEKLPGTESYHLKFITGSQQLPTVIYRYLINEEHCGKS